MHVCLQLLEEDDDLAFTRIETIDELLSIAPQPGHLEGQLIVPQSGSPALIISRHLSWWLSWLHVNVSSSSRQAQSSTDRLVQRRISGGVAQSG